METQLSETTAQLANILNPATGSTPVSEVPAQTYTISFSQMFPASIENGATFKLTVQDAQGNNIERPIIHIQTKLNNAIVEEINTNDSDYPYGYGHTYQKNDWWYAFNPSLKSGNYIFTFSGYGVSTSTEVTL